MNKKKQQKTAFIFIGLALLVAIAATVFVFLMPQLSGSGKSVLIDVLHSDGSTNSFQITTDSSQLLTAAVQRGIVVVEEPEGTPAIISADGEAADLAAGESWQFFTEGKPIELPPQQQPIADGQHYSLQLVK